MASEFAAQLRAATEALRAFAENVQEASSAQRQAGAEADRQARGGGLLSGVGRFAGRAALGTAAVVGDVFRRSITEQSRFGTPDVTSGSFARSLGVQAAGLNPILAGVEDPVERARARTEQLLSDVARFRDISGQERDRFFNRFLREEDQRQRFLGQLNDRANAEISRRQNDRADEVLEEMLELGRTIESHLRVLTGQGNRVGTARLR